MRLLKTILTLSILTISLFGQEVDWSNSWNDALKKAEAENKLIMLMVTQEHCRACEFMKYATFSKDSVIDEVNRYYVPIMLDINELPDNLKVDGTPTIRFYTPAGKKIRYKLVGGINYKEFLPKIQQLRKLFYKSREE